jgi:flavin reductase (DIM6/NTAB) family NADH-FMN oxidoreductase RutF
MKRSAAAEGGGLMLGRPISIPPPMPQAAAMPGDADLPIDTREYRRTLGLFASGVAVIATEFGGSAHAMTANAVSAVSLDPPLVLFCPGKRSKLAEGLSGMRGFTINFLRADQEALATYFAGGWREAAAPPFRLLPARCAPRLEGSLASLDCRMHGIMDGGDHWIIVGQVMRLHCGIEPHRPLLFFRGQYRNVDESTGVPAPDFASVRDEPAHIHYER